ncbi:MAG: tetraacyldisaccharide 4'-kinase [Magnetovibrio sp.]|nr:tetraacyldisaccharide 4'-kinase [Magnetovibrio sp.]
MKAPGFWAAGQGGLVSWLLVPASWVYRLGARTRDLAAGDPWSCPVPVMCVGNLTVGGAGKTPVALDLGRRLLARGVNVHFLSRGYGGNASGPLRVEPDRHQASEVGDEPLLLAAVAPTWVAVDRAAGARRAVEAGAGAIVMDDGFQNPTIIKDTSVLVFDGGFGLGNGRLVPAGPLREPLADGLARAQAVAIIGDDETALARKLAATRDGSPLVLGARYHADGAPRKDGRFVAFAGIGRPEKFFATLQGAGYDVREAVPFPDHHPYSRADMSQLAGLAERHGASLITTTKDHVRVPLENRASIETLTITLQWDDETGVEGLLQTLGV